MYLTQIRSAAARCAGILAALCMAFAGVLVLADPAGAHSELRETSPGTEQTVGGRVDQIQLAFLGRILPEGAELTVTGPDGEEVPPTGSVSITGGIVTRPLTPLTVPGEYTVRYGLLSEDDDFVRDGYVFTYDPDASAPIPVVGAPVEDDPPNIVARVLALSAMAFFAFAVLYAVFSPKLRRRGRGGD